MICYKCGSVLGAGRLCLHCGANVVTYRKIIKTSNMYYNAGLEKARVRDLSGAAACLRRAVEYDKKNIKARNLLGLVYYEMGEMVDALGQWIVSKNYQPHENVAEDYINEIQNNKKELEETNQAINAYNQALDNAKHDADDLAIIALKRIVKDHPKFVKAYQLLALLYIKEEDYSNANKIIKKGLETDKNNILLQNYAGEIKGKLGRGKATQHALIEKTKELASRDSLVPETSEGSNKKAYILGALGAVALCFMAYFFLIRPSVNRATTNTVNQNAISYYEKTEDKDSQIQSLSSELEKIKGQIDENNAKVEKYTGDDGSIVNYERILTAMQQMSDGKYDELMTTYSEINAEVIESDVFKDAYNEIGTFIGSDGMYDKMMTIAIKYFKSGKYDACLKACQNIIAKKADYVQAIYYIGLSYEAKGDDATASTYFKDIVTNYASSEYYDLAKKRVG